MVRLCTSPPTHVAIFFLVFFSSLTSWQTASFAAAPRVLIRGTSQFNVSASGHKGALKIVGTLRDDSGAPISDATIAVTPIAEPDTIIPWLSIENCQTRARSVDGTIDSDIITDSSGTFCIEGKLAQSEALLRFVYAGGALHDGTRLVVVWKAQQQPVTVTFDPVPERIDLDDPRVLVFARVAASSGQSAEGLVLTLADDRGSELASGSTDAHGTARFDFASSSLSGPGAGSLTVTFAGSDSLAQAQATTTITRSAHTILTVDDPDVRGDPSRGVSVRVGVRSSRGDVLTGSVEARVEDEHVGIGTVQAGGANVLIRYVPMRNAKTRSVVFRYRADTAYYHDGEPLRIDVTAVEPSAGLRSIPIALCVVIAGWLLRGWWRPRRRKQDLKPSKVLRGEPSVDVTRRSASSDQWTGHVVDAHEGTPVVAARVRVVFPTFVDHQTVVDAQTDATGAFSFRLRSMDKNLRLLVEATYHSSIEHDLPPASEMVIALATRRRTLLDRMVKWARQAGKPWHLGPDPTPRHIVQVALRRRGDAISDWARTVERCAFGHEPVDQRLDDEVRDLEPREQALR